MLHTTFTVPFLMLMLPLYVDISPSPGFAPFACCDFLSSLWIIGTIVSLVGTMDMIDPAHCSKTSIEKLMMPIMKADPSTYAR